MKNEIINRIKKYPILSASLAYFIIAIIFTFPIILKVNTEIPRGGGDVYQVISSIDRLVSQITLLDFPHKIIFLVKNVNTFTPYVVLNMVFDRIAAYNILFLLTYILSGLGLFLLARHLTKNQLASFVAGIIFAFAPFHYYQSVAVHLGTMQQQWLPFLVLMLILFFEKLEFKYFAGMTFFAFMIAMAEHQLLAFSVIFIGLFVLYKIIIDRSLLKNKKLWVYAACSAGLMAVAALTMFGQLLSVATSENNFLDAGINSANKYSMKLLDPFMPPIAQPIWGGFSEKIQLLVWGDSNRGSYFIGFSVIALFLYFGYLLWKKKGIELLDRSYRNNLIFWSGSALMFYLFSLGVSFSLGKRDIYMPYYLIYKFVPFYENIRTTGRFFIWAMLAVAILAAYAFCELLKKYSNKQLLLTFVFTTLVLAEFWVAPIATMPVRYSIFYDTLAKDTAQYNLIEIPGSTSYEFASYEMFLSTIHGKKVFNGMPLARKISHEFAFQQNTPVIKQLLYTMPKGNDPDKKIKPDIVNEFNYDLSNEILTYYNVRYVTINKQYAEPKIIELEENFIKQHIEYVNRYEDDYLIAYEVKREVPEGYYVLLGDSDQIGLSFEDKANGDIHREIGDGATLKVVNMSANKLKVKFSLNAKSSGSPLQLSMQNGKVLLARYTLDSSNKDYFFETELVGGENIYTFAVTDLQGKSVAISTAKKIHSAALISNISVIVE